MSQDELPETEADLRPTSAPRSTRLAVRYSLGKVLGEGGMGEVLACRDVLLDRTVALKVVRRDREAKQHEARFVREARVQAQLEHPGVVPVFDVGRDEKGSAYFTMRKVSGKTLDELLDAMRAGKPTEGFDRHRLLAAFAQLCLTIDYAHSRGVLHRDLKPSNVMLGEYGEVYALDWGVAKVAPERPSERAIAISTDAPLETAAGTTMGTPAYMAPEQLASQPIDARADVFALGAILFEIVALEPLFDDTKIRNRIVQREVTWDARPSVRAPQASPPPEFDRICERATAPKPEHRYPTARALHEAVEAYLQGARDTELRKAKAREHVLRSRELLASDRDTALVEANRALALAPEDPDATLLLVEIMSAQPEPTKADRRAIGEEQGARLRKTQPLAALLYVVPWLTVYPVVAMMRGVRSIPVAVIPPAMWVVAGLAIMVDFRRKSQDRVVYPTILVMAAVATTSLVVGPFFIMPCLAATSVAGHVMVGARKNRLYTIAAGVAALAIPSVLAWAGVDPVYRFIGDGLFEVHGALRTTKNADALSWLLMGVHVILLVGVLAYSGSFREAIDLARRKNALIAWQLDRLLPRGASKHPSQTENVNRTAERIPITGDTQLEGTPADVATSTATGEIDGGDAPDPLALEGDRYDSAEPSTIAHDRLVGRDVVMLPTTPPALLQAKLDHPGIPSIYDTTGALLTMRRAQGTTLADVPRAPGSRHRLLGIYQQLCLTIEYAHAQGVVHGQLDTEHVVVGDFGETWVVDWSRARGDATPDDVKKDIQALASILFDLLTGQAPTSADERPSSRTLDVSSGLDAVHRAAAHGEGSARSLHDAIAQYLGGDRDETLRRSLAERHLARAKRRIDRVLEGKDESVREEALGELGRAIALAPDRGPALRELARLLEAPPDVLPPDVDELVDRQAWRTAQGAAPVASLSLGITWILIYPIFLAVLGVRQPLAAAAVGVTWALTAVSIWLFSLYAPRNVRVPVSGICGLIAVATTSLLFGPHVFTPTAAVGAALGFTLGSRTSMHRMVAILSVLAVAVPSLANIAHLTDTSRFITTGVIPVVQINGAVYVSPNALHGTLLFVNVGALLLAAAYAGRFRDVLDDIEARNRARLNQLSRLLS